jgi:hypothetical protein
MAANAVGRLQMKRSVAVLALFLPAAMPGNAQAADECGYWTHYLDVTQKTCKSLGTCGDIPEIKQNIAKSCGTVRKDQPKGKVARTPPKGPGAAGGAAANAKSPTGSGGNATAPAGSGGIAASPLEGPSAGAGTKSESSAGDCGPYTYRFGNPATFTEGTEPWADAMCGMSVPPRCNTYAGDNYGSFPACREALITHPLGEGAYQNPKRLRGN